MVEFDRLRPVGIWRVLRLSFVVPGARMFEEKWIHARLGSLLFASLVQVVELTTPAVSADMGAGRFYNAPSPTPQAYVSAGPESAECCRDATVHDWPTDQQSIFEQIRGRLPQEMPFRPTKVLNGSTGSSKKKLFGPIAAEKRIVDALAITMPFDNNASCLLLLLRCGDNGPFKRQHEQRLQRLRPFLAQALQRAFHQETRHVSPHDASHISTATPLSPAGVYTPQSPASLLAKLSRTEQQVLSYLRSRYTEREIASRMRRSPHTVHVHVKNIYRKLSINSRKELLSMFE